MPPIINIYLLSDFYEILGKLWYTSLERFACRMKKISNLKSREYHFGVFTRGSCVENRRYGFSTENSDFRQSQNLSEFEFRHAVNGIQQILAKSFE